MIEIIGGSKIKTDDGFTLQSSDNMLVLQVKSYKLFMLLTEKQKHYVIPVNNRSREYHGNDLLWILPEEIESPEPAIMLKCPNEKIRIKKKLGSFVIEIKSSICMAQYYENRPQCDFFGNRILLKFDKGELFSKTLAAFYWDSMLAMVVERTVAKNFPFSDGYVLSTLQKGAYPGTYPDVDHEFQVKGRIALSGELDLEVVKRMIELQLDVMRKDPEGKWRNPCSIQPKGNREYHVTRGTMRGKTRAIMFLLTGNIEIIESIWLYVAKTKDFMWLESIISDLEAIAGFVEEYIDESNRLWSDVYYEDQVIKDGRETIAQAFAANGFILLSELELKLNRSQESARYKQIADNLAKSIVKPLPEGYWDEKEQRFIDWIDRAGNAHDHIHLLANTLPITFDYAQESQVKKVEKLLEAHKEVFHKFPSFVAAKIEDYSKEEIGDGGPYDLCAAGRYWCWDAEYLSHKNDREKLEEQLKIVALQAANDRYIMGERYDMNYIYYQNKKMWHGAGHYYEYPNVFAWVLIHLYMGIKPHLEYDYLISPKLNAFGEVHFYNIRYQYAER
ncbi:MAG TPA: hypothetical protein VN131_04790, partial [Mobilitalea sp.]|nr:hypothetical protein [Mobilitalea sp.]